ncbi:tRNA epoxyqueuosine(34) reductase QueG [Paenibacillus pectinilyticus]|uniref:tRNA epoxyqueuosine(34) reductase QueG n=1 Tax=Paenibacillus pectinilyticus TaxID=512399 RepID=A0A1C1A673_9BACL|nr:tRNA epoxyqueuosine(34) reductase QueG [Paenibacillus pectinilyticus]OCT16039.1 tRNA epoxyqueuosine(34) reductase QueG [Paenibacillus pectinilyticus]
MTVSGEFSLDGTRLDWRKLKQEIVEAAPSLGIDKIGFTSAEPFHELRDILLRHREKGFESGFEEPDIDKRVYPELSFESPRSIISIAVAYPSKLADPPRSEPGAYRGIISRSSWGSDYHDVLRDRLAKLEAFIAERVPEARLQSMVDTGVLVDRAVAERAGIGWSGKNCAVITPEWGSWVYLGEIITNIPFESDISIMDQCGDCTICIDACPTGALVGPGQLNSSRCISFITQTKGYVDDEYKRKIGNRLYGCDTCQIVCPKNKGMNWTHHPEFTPDPEKVKPLLIPLLTMSNKDFKEQYGRIAASWRGKKPIQRNAIIALGNFKDRSAVPVLVDLLRSDPRPEIRATAAWALGRIGGEEAVSALERAAAAEQEPQVQTDIDKALAAQKSTAAVQEE